MRWKIFCLKRRFFIFFENFSLKLEHRLTENFRRPGFDVPEELCEGFALYFGDKITGLKSPLEKSLSVFENDDLDGDKIRGIYNELHGLGKRSFSTDNLYDIALRYQ